MKNYLILAFFLIFSVGGQAENVKLFKNFGLDNPMSYQFVRSIAQDQHGFIWFGSGEGLHRFDGYQLLSYHHDFSRPTSLSSSVTSRILIDSKQRLWVGTRGGGLNLFRPQSQDFFRINTKSQAARLTNDGVNALFEDQSGQLWVGTENGLNILSHDGSQWQVKQIHQELGNPNSLTHNTVHSIIEGPNRQIWAATNGGSISVFDLHGRFIKSLSYQGKGTDSHSIKYVNSLFYDPQGFIWIGTVDNGLFKYDIKNERFSHYRFDETDSTSVVSNTIENIYQDSSKRVWVATDKGVLIYNHDADSFWRFNHSPNNPNSLSNDYVLTLFEDKNQMMWLGTFTGVNRWDPNMTPFNQYSAQTNPTLINNNITSFAQRDDNHIIFSSYSGGIYQLSLADNQISRIDLNQHFSELRVMSLLAEGNILWVGTRASGLYEVDLTSKKIKTYRNNQQDSGSIAADSITDIIRDSKGRLWVATFHQGLNLLNRDGTFSRYAATSPVSERGPSSNHVLQILEDDQGFLWLATYGAGINRFDASNETFTHLKHDPEQPGSLSSDLAWIMLQDRDNNLWVGTQAAGLNILSKEDLRAKNYVFSHMDTKDGMKTQTVFGMSQDSNGDIWFSSNKGVSRYSPSFKNFKHFDLSHGLIDLEYNHGSIFQGRDNTLYFGAGKGFVSVNPEQINNESPPPPVRLTNILKLNEPMSFEQSLAQLTTLELEYDDQLISFEYVGLNYSTPESTRYKYRLLGFDREWIDAGKSRRATYTNLPAGSYELQVIAGNNDNHWSESPRSLAIIVKPAPWNTWWAYLGYALVIALCLLSYSRFLNRKLLSEQQQKIDLKRQVKEKTSEFKLKNIELEQANKELENAAIVDRLTGVKSRRYLDIYIEQASGLMSQIHHNILPVQRSLLPRLYFVMVRISSSSQLKNSQLINLTDLLLYSRNSDDLVIRWSHDTFAIIGYEKDDNARELVNRLSNRLEPMFGATAVVKMAYAFYPFNLEQPMELSWDQVSVVTEHALNVATKLDDIQWLGFYQPKLQPFDYLALLRQHDCLELAKLVKLKQG